MHDHFVECIGWRATQGCSPYSKRDEAHDLPCEAVVPSTLPGYCLCENGRRTAFSDCRHIPFTCQKRCASLPRLDCPLFDESLRSNSAKGCSGSVTLQNRMREAVQVMWVSDTGGETLLNEINPIGSYTVPSIFLSDSEISGVCIPFSIRVYSHDKLLFQRTLQSADSLHFPITDCYGMCLLRGAIQRNPSHSIRRFLILSDRKGRRSTSAGRSVLKRSKLEMSTSQWESV